jgi:hypothetical protein
VNGIRGALVVHLRAPVPVALAETV